jgi:DNA-binding GntR family transcriptional regulator
MSRSEIEDACFARYLLEAGAACEERSVIDEELVASLDKELDVMEAAAAAGDMAAIVESDTHLHGLLVETGGRTHLVELWHSLDSRMGALMRSTVEFQEADLASVVERHRVLVDAIRTEDRAGMAEAIKHHYLDPDSLGEDPANMVGPG